jgi:hypothetical protein
MADITERPADQSAGQATPSSAPTSAPAAAATRPDEVYRPLSLLAILGFCLGVLFAGVISVFAVIALFTRTPFFPPLGVFLIPAVVCGICWLARQNIRQSENTLSGEQLALWGLGLSVVVTVLFAAYYGATYLAVSQQAGVFADRWIEAMKEGNAERAFWYLIEPGQRVSIPQPAAGARDPKVRTILEVKFGGGGKGLSFPEFRRGPLLTVFRQGKTATVLRRIGVTEWTYDKGSYDVTLRYHLESPEAATDLIVTVSSQEAVPGEEEGRQWYIKSSEKETGLVQPVHFTPVGQKYVLYSQDAAAVAAGWHLGRSDAKTLWLACVPAAQRDTVEEAFKPENVKKARCASLPGLSGPGMLAVIGEPLRNQTTSRRWFEHGGLLDTTDFWALTPEVGGDMLRRVRGLFAAGANETLGMFAVAQTGVPAVQERDGLAFVTFDATITLPNDEMTAPLYEVLAQITLEGIEDPQKPGHRAWHIHRLALISGHRASGPGKPGGRR